MKKTCEDCIHLEYRETKKSKLPYGYCKELNLILISVQLDCDLHTTMSKEIA